MNIYRQAINEEIALMGKLEAERMAIDSMLAVATGEYTMGTAYFKFDFHARQYYRKQGIDAAGVTEKINAGEIFIGAPPYTNDVVKMETDADGRYRVTYNPKRPLESDRASIVRRRLERSGWRRYLNRMAKVKPTKAVKMAKKSELEALLKAALHVKWDYKLPYCCDGFPHYNSDVLKEEEDKPENHRLTSFIFGADRFDIGTVRVCKNSTVRTYYGMMDHTTASIFKNGKFLSVLNLSVAQCVRLVMAPSEKDIVDRTYIQQEGR